MFVLYYLQFLHRMKRQGRRE